MSEDRTVVLICGPPGAGKTTEARTLAKRAGLDLYDLDDPRWGGSERRFRHALERLGRDSRARAVVIRSGATRSARATAAELIGATAVRVMATDPRTCIERVVARKRRRPPVRRQVAAVKSWWARYEPEEPGSGFFDGSSSDRARSVVSLPVTRKREKTADRGYGTRHQAVRARLAPLVAAGQAICARCARRILPGEPWDLGHVDGDRTRYAGPEHRACNRATAGRRPRRRRRRQSRRW